MQTLSVIDLQVPGTLMKILVTETRDKARVQLLESVLELLELWEDEERLLLAATVVISCHRCQVVVVSVVCAICGIPCCCIYFIHHVAFVLCAYLGSLESVNDSIMDRNLSIW